MVSPAAHRLRTRRAVVHPVSDEPIDARDLEPTPVDPGGDDHGPRVDPAAVLEDDGVESAAGPRISDLDLHHRSRDDQLGPEALGLPAGAIGQLLPTQAGREPEVVLDPRGRSRLSSARHPLDQQRVQPFARAIHRRGEARGSPADDEHVIAVELRLGLQVERLRELTAGRRLEAAAVAEDDHSRRHRLIGARGIRALAGIPPERDPVAAEKLPDVVAAHIETMPDHLDPGELCLHGNLPEPPDPGQHRPRHLLVQDGALVDEVQKIVRFESQEPARFDGLQAGECRGPQEQGDLAEVVARSVGADGNLAPVDGLDDFHSSLEHAEERGLLALHEQPLIGIETHVRGAGGDGAALARRDIGEERDVGEVVGGDHPYILAHEEVQLFILRGFVESGDVRCGLARGRFWLIIWPLKYFPAPLARRTAPLLVE